MAEKHKKEKQVFWSNKAVQEAFAGKAFCECHIGVVLTNHLFTKSAMEFAQKDGIIL